MYKIFIDTNIILNFYRINNAKSIKEILKDIKRCRKYFISTKQSKDEFLRNRDITIKDFMKKLEKQTYNVQTNNVVETLNTYQEYVKSIAEANKNTKKIIGEINKLIENPEIDLINQIYLNLNQVVYDRNDEIIERATKRKLIGNPPTSNKKTCGDEIIWETLLEYCHEDLIIVSRDATFIENYHFLDTEYTEKTGKKLKIVDTISKAIELNNELPSQELEFFESDLVMETELKEHGELQENSNWANIIYHALQSLGNKADLKEIYDEAKNIVKEKYPEKLNNKHIEETIRGMLQRYSSDSKYFNGKNDLFVQIKKGTWGIRNS